MTSLSLALFSSCKPQIFIISWILEIVCDTAYSDVWERCNSNAKRKQKGRGNLPAVRSLARKKTTPLRPPPHVFFFSDMFVCRAICPLAACTVDEVVGHGKSQRTLIRAGLFRGRAAYKNFSLTSPHGWRDDSIIAEHHFQWLPCTDTHWTEGFCCCCWCYFVLLAVDKSDL